MTAEKSSLPRVVLRADPRRYLGVHVGILRSEAVLVTGTGDVLARVVGPGASPRRIGIGNTIEAIASLFEVALQCAGLEPGTTPDRVVAIVADVDLQDERDEVRLGLEQRLRTPDLIVENDVHGLLWAGMRRPAGVALICGAGINAIARASTGARAEYLALGRISGDWGGALELGREVLYVAQRSADGRGPRTRLQYDVPAHFQTVTMWDAVVAFWRSPNRDAQLEALAQRLFVADEAGDGVARGLVDRLADEVVGMVTAAARRVRLPATGADIVLSGWVLTSGFARLDQMVDRGIAERMPGATILRFDKPLVIGAALACFGAERGGPLAREGNTIAKRIEDAGLVDVARPGDHAFAGGGGS